MNIRDRRSIDSPGNLEVALSLSEKRFSSSPQLRPLKPVLDAGDGPFSSLNRLLVSETDRMIVEAEFLTRRARSSSIIGDIINNAPGLSFVVTDF